MVNSKRLRRTRHTSHTEDDHRLNDKQNDRSGSVHRVAESLLDVPIAFLIVLPAAAADRKIIRNGDLTIETDSPTDGQHKITSIAESHGGFVVTSEFKHNDGANQSKPSQTVIVVVRVPSPQFVATLDQFRDIGGRVLQEKVTGQDVSEEYLDLEARIRTKKALETHVPRDYEAGAKSFGCARGSDAVGRCSNRDRTTRRPPALPRKPVRAFNYHCDASDAHAAGSRHYYGLRPN